MRNRILVVDDSPYVADASARLITVCGYETQVAYGGWEAIERVTAFSPNMVLMDIGMPDLDGYQVATTIRREPHNAEILLVAVTCLDQEQDKQRAFDSGFDVHIPKPIELRTLYGLLTMLQNLGLHPSRH
jgi:CheY-like chemotaxis protein